MKAKEIKEIFERVNKIFRPICIGTGRGLSATRQLSDDCYKAAEFLGYGLIKEEGDETNNQ